MFPLSTYVWKPRAGPAACLVLVLALTGVTSRPALAETWRGLAVAPEYRCSPYRSDDYRYPQSVEPQIVATMSGRIYGPYTGRDFESIRQTDIEHIVARSEAHDSGLCAADAATRRRFAADLDNLTLASPSVNRGQKKAKDAADWLPAKNECWFAGRVVEVKQEYGLTVDRREAEALDRVLSGCATTAMVMDGPTIVVPPKAPTPPAVMIDQDALALYDDNGNGRITCKEARKAGIAPVYRDHPAYPYMRDGDGDGVVCK